MGRGSSEGPLLTGRTPLDLLRSGVVFEARTFAIQETPRGVWRNETELQISRASCDIWRLKAWRRGEGVAE